MNNISKKRLCIGLIIFIVVIEILLLFNLQKDFVKYLVNYNDITKVSARIYDFEETCIDGERYNYYITKSILFYEYKNNIYEISIPKDIRDKKTRIIELGILDENNIIRTTVFLPSNANAYIPIFFNTLLFIASLILFRNLNSGKYTAEYYDLIYENFKNSKAGKVFNVIDIISFIVTAVIMIGGLIFLIYF